MIKAEDIVRQRDAAQQYVCEMTVAKWFEREFGEAPDDVMEPPSIPELKRLLHHAEIIKARCSDAPEPQQQGHLLFPV